jgi:predicted RNA-binding protein with PIN domain
MRILIDGYNLIRRIPDLDKVDRMDLQGGRDALLGQLASYRRGKNHRITVVFDGADAVHLGGSRERIGGISVRYSPRGMSADRVILDSIRKSEADILVSADRELTDAAKRSGVTFVTPEFFWDKVLGEIYRQMKGEEEVDRIKGKGSKGRKLSRAQRKDRGRRENL